MTAYRTLVTTRRVLRQLAHDPRTVVLMLSVPCLLLTLLSWVYDASPQTFDRVGSALLGVLPLNTMFLVTSVSTLKERTSGTLERLLSLPLAKADLVVGYALAFAVVAVLQVALATSLAVHVLGVRVAGPVWLLLLVALWASLLGIALGLSVSAFAVTEYQALQFAPAVLLPQILVSGLLVPRGSMPSVVRAVADWSPISRVVDAEAEVRLHPDLTVAFGRDLAFVAAWVVLVLLVGAATLRRRS
ncbi:ABC transporter permease [Kitasatospora sp. LaBMicrA B282]|uniref:ABC transporter permease n=1 Tax=Kitasatospora sp. LaBMicrA B282 TaxID=3420949 RepID=UPI003D0E11A9